MIFSNPSEQKQGEPHHEPREKPQVHPGQEHIVTTILEVGYPAIGRFGIANLGRHVDRLNPCPAKSDNSFGVKIEASHP